MSAAGQHLEARTTFQNTLVAAKTMDMPLQRGEALEGIGQEESVLGRDEQTRAAYTDARAFYRAEQSRLGEANVLRGLGHLESQDNPDVARQYLHLSAGLYEAIDMKALSDLARKEAHALTQEQPF